MEAFIPVDAPLELELGDAAWVGGLVVCDGSVGGFARLLSFFTVFYVDQPFVYKESFYDVFGDKVHELSVEVVPGVEDARDTCDIFSV